MKIFFHILSVKKQNGMIVILVKCHLKKHKSV